MPFWVSIMQYSMQQQQHRAGQTFVLLSTTQLISHKAPMTDVTRRVIRRPADWHHCHRQVQTKRVQEAPHEQQNVWFLCLFFVLQSHDRHLHSIQCNLTRVWMKLTRTVKSQNRCYNLSFRLPYQTLATLYCADREFVSMLRFTREGQQRLSRQSMSLLMCFCMHSCMVILRIHVEYCNRIKHLQDRGYWLKFFCVRSLRGREQWNAMTAFWVNNKWL